MNTTPRPKLPSPEVLALIAAPFAVGGQAPEVASNNALRLWQELCRILDPAHQKARAEAKACIDAKVREILPKFIREQLGTLPAGWPSVDFRGDARCLVSALFQPGDRVNYVTEWTRNARGKINPKGDGVTLERDALLALWARQPVIGSEPGGWLRLNPIDGKGVGDANVTACRFALVEFDDLPLALQLSFVAKLPLPVAAFLTSGGRSIHTWLKVDAPDASEYRATTHKLAAMLWKYGACQGNKSLTLWTRFEAVAPRAATRTRP